MPYPWVVISAVSAAVSAVVVIVAGFYARAQVHEIRSSRKLDLLRAFYDRYQHRDLRDFRAALMSGEYGGPEEFSYDSLPAEQAYLYGLLVDNLEYLSILVDKKLVDFDSVLALLYTSPPRVWAIAGKDIKLRRSNRSPLFAVHFERLIDRYDAELPKHEQRMTKRGPSDHIDA